MKCPKCKNYFFNKIATVYAYGTMKTFHKCKSCGFEDIQEYKDKYEE